MTSTASEVYPVKCQKGSPVLRGLTKVKLPRRSRALPDLYKFDGIHPSHQVKLPTSSTYVYLVDSSHEGKEVFDRISDAQKVPSGPIAGLAGLLELLPGDALLARPIDREGDPLGDCLQVLVGVNLVKQSIAQTELLMRAGYTPEDVLRC
ncbi:hypothetical protein BC629DRAFT_1598239 [Irpex lacteus]|nr:hypothetical protein BC629DRAFT_1598239 [Irpex lacteus]